MELELAQCMFLQSAYIPWSSILEGMKLRNSAVYGVFPWFVD